MRSFAEFIMRGRLQAYSIALLGGLVPFFGQLAVGLVTLRKGWQEGLFVVLWGSLPILAQLWLGHVDSLWTYVSVAVLAATFAGALVLRVTISWVTTLIAMLAIASLGAFVIFLSYDSLTGQMQQTLSEVAEQTEPGKKFVEAFTATNAKVLGAIAAWLACVGTIGVIASRWLQAMVFNPGGFAEEFRALRLSPAATMVCAVGLAGSFYAGQQYEFWGVLFSLPMFFAGLGLVHHTVAKRNWGVAPLVAMYASFVFIGLTTVIVVVLGMSDAWVNYRNMLAKRSD